MEEQAQVFCAENEVQVRLFWEMPRGYEEDANAYAYAQVCVLCGETDALRRLREFWRSKRAWTAEEYRRLFRRIDRAVGKVE